MRQRAPRPEWPDLLRFLVRRVLAAAAAELLELETAGGRLLVLRRRVVPLLALGALQCNNFAHLFILPHRLRPASPQIQALRWPLPFISYFKISVMVPAPTVLPPSRMAK